jgi:glycerate 2-kinase
VAVAGIPTTVLVAPDAFKGTLRASEVAAAIARGLQRAGMETDLCPIADGGEGTLEALLDPLGAEIRTVPVEGPMGAPVEVPFGLTAAGRRGATAVVEAAAASGFDLVAARERDPVKASTYGTGELIASALQAGARTVLVGAGGTATTDGGSGAIAALKRAGGVPDSARLVVLCDVRTPFEDAARLFAPQKGATPDQVRRLTRRLHALARRFGARDPRGVPLTGAAGGLSGALWAAFGAELVPGASYILDAIGFEPRLRRARAVVTGEGRLDPQSLAGKALSEVATRARQSGVPCHAIVGSSSLDRFGMRILDLQAVLEAGATGQLTAAGRRIARLV